MLRVRVTLEGLAQVDAARGNWTRSEYIRRAIKKALNEGMIGPTSNGDAL